MKRVLLTLLFLVVLLRLGAHPWRPSNYVIIDTDGGIDDMKAIALLLSSPDIRVLAITVSPGVLSAEDGYKKVKSFLNSLYHEGIPVGINRIAGAKPSSFPFAMRFSWGDESQIDPRSAPGYLDIIRFVLSNEKAKIRFICLGGMSTAWSALKTIDDFPGRIKDFVWSVDGVAEKKGFNYEIDREASEKMLRQEIPVKIVRSFDNGEKQFYDDDFQKELLLIRRPYAGKINSLFSTGTISGHNFILSATDEMAALFIHYPELFIIKTAYSVSDCTPSDYKGIREGFLKILKGETVPKNQVLINIPENPSFYFDDISSSVSEIIEKYGIDEWTSGVIANELHRHLGVFAIIGVKMGIRAREYFNTGVDEFTLFSSAGSIPPLSCMNDGLQVSTGATPGHGLLTVKNEEPYLPSAEFKYMGQRIRLTLKPEIAEKISGELKEINFIYGLDSNIYWELVRKNSIRYWKDLDRHLIFNIEVL